MSNITVVKTCIKCRKDVTITGPEDQIMALANREGCAQNVAPSIHPDLREMFISGICATCWDRMFGEPEPKEA